jgi:hypothetical protein
MYRYFGSIAVGTPPVTYNVRVVLDTGSADLWLVDPQCTQNCGGSPPYSPSSSSTFANVNKPFAIAYSSGGASGYLAQDVVQIAGFRVQNQSLGMFNASLTDCSMTPTSGLCDQISSNLLIQPVSGVMGLAWQAQSSAGVKLVWY